MLKTPENITFLKANEIFVFGSNLSGIHGAGAAKLAYDLFGAEWRNHKGIQGNSYAIPTKNVSITKTLSLNEISKHVSDFIEFAKQNSHLTFYVTKIGCGLAGLKEEQVAPLFIDALEVENIALPEDFIEILSHTKNSSKKLF